jgi:hypothetical protein
MADNWPAVVMWSRIQTQWRVSMGGPIGLDYSALSWMLSLYPSDNPQLLVEDLQVMEAAALEAMAEGSEP